MINLKCGDWVGSNAMTGILIRRGHSDREADTHTSRTPSNMKAEMGGG